MESVPNHKCFSIFIDNLPEQMCSWWLRRVFNRCGTIVDAFIPFKRRRFSNSKFGFVRYLKEEEANEAIRSFNGVWWQGHLLLMKRATILSGKRLIWRKKKSHFPHPLSPEGDQIWRHNQVPEDQSPYSIEGVEVNPDGSSFTVNAEEIDDSWVKTCAVGIVRDYKIIPMIEEAMRIEGVNFVIIKPLGGVKVLLQFNTMEDMKEMLQGSRWWLETWFDEVYEWHCREFTLSRRVWLAIEGVPLNAWNSATFTKIASNWGRVFSVDGKTSSRMELERGKVLVETNFKNSIDGFCKLKVGQFLYNVRVSEMEFQKIYMLGSSYYPKAAVKMDEDDGDHINVGEDVLVRSGHVLQDAVLAGDIEGLAPRENYGDDDVALLSQVEDSFDVTRSIIGTDLRTLEAELPDIHQRTESNALCSSSSHPMLSQNQVRKSPSPNHASYPNHLNPSQALIFPQKISPIRIHKSTNRRKKLSLLELGLPHKFLNKGRYAKGSNKKSKDAKLGRSSQPSQSSIPSSTIRVCNKCFLNKLVESDQEME
ncbi:hypothetical protein LOK49_LG11G01162 [Camellia lanceoleosa]|uniref:Uncharacterized protein n=1 Tax=Camellia lanceoleosa TaxID=1840588 RepID=A0ACC0G0A0_9ERIC|nr:hypothetical protein LOK49_LG11G01162 [Camellia lanceoleosa]